MRFCSLTVTVALLVVSAADVSAEGPKIDLVGDGGSPSNAFPLQLCEGDCDSDRDCDSGLRCYQRDSYWAVPGCSGGEGDRSKTDFCVDEDAEDLGPTDRPVSNPTLEPTHFPTEAPMAASSSAPASALDRLVSFGPDPSTDLLPLGICQGDCDADVDCGEGLMCFQRDSYEDVPGCAGGALDLSRTDYCVVAPTQPPTMSPKELQNFGRTPPGSMLPLGQCEGDCDRDSDCLDGLYCYQRDSAEPIPSCIGVDDGSSDYCVDKALAYVPGHLTVSKIGLLLSEGLDVRIVASYTFPVEYSDGGQSDVSFHGRPDAGATFSDTRPGNEGGWVYVSNSEMLTTGDGGVGAVTFDKDGNTIDYKMVLQNSTWNCGGGRTPWNTWVSCEEAPDGDVYQIDPFGERAPQKINLQGETGRYESLAYDDRNRNKPTFYITEDRDVGALTRLVPRKSIPRNPDWDLDPWSMLHGDVTIDYLVLKDDGTFRWTTSRSEARQSAKKYYPNSEGIDFFGSQLLFVCKKVKMLYTLDIDDGEWTRSSTVSGAFDGQPDQVQRIVGEKQEMLYFTEEGGEYAGIHARDTDGRFYTVMEGRALRDETTGLAVSPDGKFIMVAYQDEGTLYSIWRKDGMPFHAHSIDIKYHATS